MVKRTYLFVVLSLASLFSYSQQVIINQLPINPARMSFDDLWSMILVNQGPAYKANIFVSVSENGMQLFELMSEETDIPNGTRTIQNNSIRFSVNTMNSNYPGMSTLLSARELPFGDYNVCVRIIGTTTPSDPVSSCLLHHFEPLTRPMLISPDYCSEQLTTTPMFVWSPPTPIISGMEVYYDLKIAEVYEGQSHQDAIDNNNPHHAATGLSSASYMYPLSATPFDTSKVYVWQISARINKYQSGEYPLDSKNQKGIGVSEVWCFHWKKREIPEDLLKSHIYPKTSIDGAYVNVGNTFFLAFKSKISRSQISVQFTDGNGKQLKTLQTLDVKRGDNRYELNLRSTGEFRHKEFYMMEIIDSKGNRTYIRFQYWEE
ncbi:MAG: hypothetical protein EP332_04690 [Bacteroidetes bacterium]|nr:MAG: hypothetical protein EP332_04690 [Bacteroidota bacterium]